MNIRVSWRPFTNNRRVASVRLRSDRPIAQLRRAGWDVALEADDRAADVVVFQKAYSERDLAHAVALQARGVRVVADFCDNHLWAQCWNPELRARADRMQALADLADVRVVASQQLATALNRPSYVVHDALRLPPRPMLGLRNGWHSRGRGHDGLRILWFGTAGGGGQTGGLTDLATVLPMLAEVASATPTSLLVLSNSRALYDGRIAQRTGGLKTFYWPWSTPAFNAAAAWADVAVVPVTLDPFTRCKTSNRPALALLAGLACIADPVPSYSELGDGIQLGNWLANLLRYTSPEQRLRDVRLGQRAVGHVYAPSVVTAEWSNALTSAAA